MQKYTTKIIQRTYIGARHIARERARVERREAQEKNVAYMKAEKKKKKYTRRDNREESNEERRRS